jgi:chemotaxis protein MotA
LKRINKTLLFGLLLGLGLIAAAILLEIGSNSAIVFFHPVGMMIVFGGTLAASFISLPMRELGRVTSRTYYAIKAPKDDFVQTLRDIIRVSVGLNKDVLYLEKIDANVRHAMLRDALQLIAMGFKGEDIRRLLEIKREQNESSYSQCSAFYFSIAKMGPAFGLLGTLVGLIILLYYHMGNGNFDKVASSMGVALTATLYGVGLANLVFGPLAEYMQYTAEKGEILDKLVIEGAVLLKERRHPIYLVQSLKSYLPREDYTAIEGIVKQELSAGRTGPTAAAPEQKKAANG